jgi:hypothetical protein
MSKFQEKIISKRNNGESLHTILIKTVVPGLKQAFDDIAWNSLNIDYHPPKVERLWSQFGSMRLMIHRIHPSSEHNALFHPHPWPSAVFILRSAYRMGIGYGEEATPPPVAATITLTQGSSYEMKDRNGWHYVAPGKETSLSLMLIDAPWEEPHPFYTEGEKIRLNPLTEKARKCVVEDLKHSLYQLEYNGQLSS